MLKRFSRSQAAGRLASGAIRAYAGIVRRTGRVEAQNRDHYETASADGRGVIVAFWHGRLMMTPFLLAEADRPAHILISAGRDGEIIARAMRRYPVSFIRGSAANPKKPERNKMGASAAGLMLAALSRNEAVAVAPDGPRGPYRRAHAGVVKLAQMARAPILPVGLSASRGRVLGSWDRFLLVAPFSRIVMAAGPPIAPPAEGDADAVATCRATLENALNLATERADALALPKHRRKTL